MELKQIYVINLTASFRLLIVPYGIETKYARRKPRAPGLLIVPYGIETLMK